MIRIILALMLLVVSAQFILENMKNGRKKDLVIICGLGGLFGLIIALIGYFGICF